jgi:orotate phosphoribosyltransferase-like protein
MTRETLGEHHKRLGNLGSKIIELRTAGLSFKKIAKELGISLSTVSYHLTKGEKEKAYERVKKQRLMNKRYEKNRWQYKGEVNPKFPLRNKYKEVS